jgi:predicted Fe-S protein YdhL (DUF1289 family)
MPICAAAQSLSVKPMSKKKSKSPCIGVCKIDGKTGLCKGCLRSLKEIADWKKFSKSERRDMLRELKSRKTA